MNVFYITHTIIFTILWATHTSLSLNTKTIPLITHLVPLCIMYSSVILVVKDGLRTM